MIIRTRLTVITAVTFLSCTELGRVLCATINVCVCVCVGGWVGVHVCVGVCVRVYTLGTVAIILLLPRPFTSSHRMIS